MQESYFQLSRRGFIGVAGAGGVSVFYHELAQATKPGTPHLAAVKAHLGEPIPSTPTPGWSGAPGQARYRIEGMRKVTGQKIYARDFRAKDMPQWPKEERIAMVLRATITDQLLMALNLSMLPADSQPMQVIVQKAMGVQPASLPVTALDTLNLTLPFSSQGPNCTAPGADCKPPPPCTPSELLTAAGTAAAFYGQPVAILIFADLNTYRRAKRVLQFNPNVVQYGALVPLPPPISRPCLTTR